MKNETIVDRVVERLKAQPLGDLITEEDLHEIVKTAIPKVFFEARKVTEGSGYHERTNTLPPLIVEVMRDLLKDSAEKAVKDWLVTNAEVVADHWRKIMDEGVAAYVAKAQDMKMTTHVASMLRGYFDEVNKQRQAAGLMPIYLT